ncbi:unnamed protein product, partial [Ceratitis capitata]
RLVLMTFPVVGECLIAINWLLFVNCQFVGKTLFYCFTTVTIDEKLVGFRVQVVFDNVCPQTQQGRVSNIIISGRKVELRMVFSAQLLTEIPTSCMVAETTSSNPTF